jgi:nucleoid-associated protein YgaU
MTRENKLALVVGFALILLVGILVSDHFSAASRQESADLLPARDPLVAGGGEDPDLLAFEAPPNRAWHDPFQSRPSLPVETSRSEVAQPEGGRGANTRMPSPPSTEPQTPDAQARQAENVVRVGLPEADGRALQFVHHDVKRGESLTSICQEYFGDASLVKELAAYNELRDPNLLRAGMRLRIPKAAVLVRGGPPVEETAAQERTYTVRTGDVLSRIAQELLGSSRRWREVYEYNAEVIDDPDHLEVGTVLRIPSHR